MLDLASSLGIEAVERSLSPVDIAEADEVFLTNSVRFLQPVRSVDGRTVPGGAVAGRLLDALKTTVRAECGAGW